MKNWFVYELTPNGWTKYTQNVFWLKDANDIVEELKKDYAGQGIQFQVRQEVY